MWSLMSSGPSFTVHQADRDTGSCAQGLAVGSGSSSSALGTTPCGSTQEVIQAEGMTRKRQINAS